MAVTTSGLIRCEVVGDAPFTNAKHIVIKGLPEYDGGDAPFFVLNDWLRSDQEGPQLLVNIVKSPTGGKDLVIDVPGEALSFGPRLLVPAERIEQLA